MTPSTSRVAAAVSAAFRETLTHVAERQEWQSRGMSVEQTRSFTWVSLLASRLHDLWRQEPGIETRCKPFEGLTPFGEKGELLVDIHVVRTAEVPSVQTRQPIRFAAQSLLAVESEFESSSRDWLDDLSKLFLVRAPVLLFVASIAGNGRDSDLARRQLEMFAAAAKAGLPGGSSLLLARVPHPKYWAAADSWRSFELHNYDVVQSRFVALQNA